MTEVKAATAFWPAENYHQRYPELTRTPRRLRWVRTGYAYQPPALGTYRRRRAACPPGPTYSKCWVRVPALGVRYVPRTVATQVPHAALRGAHPNPNPNFSPNPRPKQVLLFPPPLELSNAEFARWPLDLDFKG